MPRLPASLLALTLSAAATLAFASCGEEDAQLLPGETAREITANLDAVQQLADEGDCTGAESAAQQVSEQISALAGVDRQLKGALEDGATRLGEVIASCEETTTEAISPAIVPEELESSDEEGTGSKGDKKDKGDGDDGGEPEPSEPPADTEKPDVPPPHAEGKGKGPDGEAPPEESEEGVEEGPSGGVSPGAPVPEGE
jgi:hypothetical protein